MTHQMPWMRILRKKTSRDWLKALLVGFDWCKLKPLSSESFSVAMRMKTAVTSLFEMCTELKPKTSSLIISCILFFDFNALGNPDGRPSEVFCCLAVEFSD